jgi:DNA-binding beta-propeller fold protein YncE
MQTMACFTGSLLLASALAGSAPAADGYYLYVAAESEDKVALARFDPSTNEVEVLDRIAVGYMETEIEGPHGLTVGPEGEYWYLTLAHGKPYGTLYKYSTATNEVVGECELGLFPATMQISEATGLLYCVNFDLHGKMEPSTVSIVDPDAMVEVSRTVTGAMPHGSRLSPDGMLHYSCSMMYDMLYEIDAVTFDLNRQLRLTTSDMPMDDAPGGMPDEKKMGEMKGGGMQGGMQDEKGGGMGGMKGGMKMPKAVAKPTWVYPHPTDKLVYVALNGAAQVVEVNTQTWKITRRFETGKGPYNVEVSRDGKRMVVTYKGDQAIGVWDLEQGVEVARIPSSRKITHGVVISPDSKYAFVSNESIGGKLGTLDVIDLESNELVATTEVGLQAGGIAFWKVGE